MIRGGRRFSALALGLPDMPKCCLIMSVNRRNRRDPDPCPSPLRVYFPHRIYVTWARADIRIYFLDPAGSDWIWVNINEFLLYPPRLGVDISEFFLYPAGSGWLRLDPAGSGQTQPDPTGFRNYILISALAQGS